MLKQRLANDSNFRELVRAIVAYLEDPEQWDKEIERTIRKIVPAKDINRFRQEILKRNPNAESLAEYFDLIGPKNMQELSFMIKNIYEGMSHSDKPLGKSLSPKPQLVSDLPGGKPSDIQKEIQKLQEENLELQQGDGGSKLRREMEDWRSKRPALSRTACFKIINLFLDSLA